jgi:integrase
VTAYLDSADYKDLAAASRSDYRRTLDEFRGAFGAISLRGIDEAWIAELREKYAGRPIAWNSLRSRMIAVTRHFRTLYPGALPSNPWEVSRRLKMAKSRLHRPWPPSVLLAVLRAATPEFRALLTGYLLTAQRGGDVTTFAPAQYDRAAQTLKVDQAKTGEPILLHVPTSLARTLATMQGRHPDRLFVTPRGQAWTTSNAQETLLRLVEQLGLERYTLHGLRATGPVALKLLGFENRAIRALTGHTSDQNLEVYLAGVDHYPLAREAQEALETQFASLLAEAEDGANSRRFSGVTGKAARRTAN